MNTDANDPTYFSASTEKKSRTPRPDEASLLDDYYRQDGRYTLFPPPAQEYVLCMKVDEMLLDVPDESCFLAPAVEAKEPVVVPAVPVAPTPPITPAPSTKSSYSYRRRRAQRAIINDPWSSEADKDRARAAAQADEARLAEAAPSRLMQLSQAGRQPFENGGTTAVPDAPKSPQATAVVPQTTERTAAQSSYHKRRMQRALNDPWRSAEYPVPGKEPEIVPFVSVARKIAKEPPVIRNVQQPQPAVMAVRKRSENLLQKVLHTNLVATADDNILLPLDFEVDFDLKQVEASKEAAKNGISTRETGAILFHTPGKAQSPAPVPQRDVEESFLLSLDDVDAPFGLAALENQLKRSVSHVTTPSQVSPEPAVPPVPRAPVSAPSSPQVRQTAASTRPVPPVPLAPVSAGQQGSAQHTAGPARSVPQGGSQGGSPSPARVGQPSSVRPAPPVTPVTANAKAAASPRKPIESGDPLIADASSLPSLRPRTAGHSKTNVAGKPSSEGQLARPHSDVEQRHATLAAAARSNQSPSRPRRNFSMVDADAEERRERWKGVSLVDDDPVLEAPAEPEGWGSKIRSFLRKIFTADLPSAHKNLLAFSYGGIKNMDLFPKPEARAASAPAAASASAPAAASASAPAAAPTFVPASAESVPPVPPVPLASPASSVVPLASAAQSARQATGHANGHARGQTGQTPVAQGQSGHAADTLGEGVPFQAASSAGFGSPLLSADPLPLQPEESPGFVTWDEPDDEDDSPLWTPPTEDAALGDSDDSGELEEVDEPFSLEALARVMPQEVTAESGETGDSGKQKRGGLLSWLSQLFKGDDEDGTDNAPNSASSDDKRS